MSNKEIPSEEIQRIELDDDFEFNEDENVNADENDTISNDDVVEETTPVIDEAVDEKEESPLSDFDIMLNARIDEKLKRHKEQMTNYVNHRIYKSEEATNERMDLIEASVEQIKEMLSTGKISMADIQKQRPSLIDSVLGGVGSFLHGTVDTVAFIAESTVDLVTLGKARRAQVQQMQHEPQSE